MKNVLVQADKAANNVIVVCKKYYLEVVVKEITATTTYEPVLDDRTKVICDHLKYMASNRIMVKPELQCLPSFYWLPKLHKQPYGNRFIAASYRCTTKPLSKLLTCCLNTIMKHFRQYCNGIYCKTGVNCFWVIENSQHVLNALNRINHFSSAKHSDSYDFSTLYTSIPHDSLKSALKSLIQEAYKVRDNSFLVVNNNGKGMWSDVPSTRQSLTEDKLISYVEYLIDNIYVSIGNKIYRQCIGIPMGTDCAPLLANLFLFFYEYRYMKSLIKNNISIARKFNNTLRCIDDLLVLNNNKFDDAIKDIYPPELQLKKTTETPTALSYLDIFIKIQCGKYSTTLYDKRDSFKFDIVNFPRMDSNIPCKPAYGVYISQVVRIGRICSSYHQFCERHHKLSERLIKQGFRYLELCKAFKKFARSHVDVFSKYDCSVRKHIQDGMYLPACDMFLGRHVSIRRGFGKHQKTLTTQPYSTIANFYLNE